VLLDVSRNIGRPVLFPTHTPSLGNGGRKDAEGDVKPGGEERNPLVFGWRIKICKGFEPPLRHLIRHLGSFSGFVEKYGGIFICCNLGQVDLCWHDFPPAVGSTRPKRGRGKQRRR